MGLGAGFYGHCVRLPWLAIAIKKLAQNTVVLRRYRHKTTNVLPAVARNAECTIGYPTPPHSAPLSGRIIFAVALHWSSVVHITSINLNRGDGHD